MNVNVIFIPGVTSFTPTEANLSGADQTRSINSDDSLPLGMSIGIKGEREPKGRTSGGLFTLTQNDITHRCGITSYYVVRLLRMALVVWLNKKTGLAVLLWKVVVPEGRWSTTRTMISLQPNTASKSK